MIARVERITRPVPMIPPADVLKTILVVDDNQDMLSFVSSCMKESFNVFTASDGSVETMASEVGMSRSTLYKKLMAITGLGPAEFIRTIRVKRGKALLETSQMQITEIAYAVGFTTVKSFTMNFKAEYGVTPTEFRQKQN